MPASKKPRKRRQERQTLANAHAIAMNAVTRLTPAEVEQGAGAAEKAFDALEIGDDPAFQWAVLADTFNVAEALADERICSDVASREAIAAARLALARLHRQHQVLGSWVLWPEDHAALLAGVELHRLQLSVCDYAEYRRAIDSVIRRMKGARAGNVAPGTQVLGVDMGAPGGDQTVYYLPDENGRPALCSPKGANHA